MINAMFAMVLLTIVVGLVAFKTRVASVKTGAVRAKFYSLMQGQDVPDNVVKSTRNFNNQFEVPVLFYVVCTLHVVLGLENLVALVAAWAFVGFRVAHAYIHLNYNYLLHRVIAFWAAVFCVLVLWLNVMLLKP